MTISHSSEILNLKAPDFDDPEYQRAMAQWNDTRKGVLLRNALEGFPACYKDFQNQWIETPSYKRLKRDMGRVFKGEGTILYLHGKCGTGKTWAACKIAHEVILSERNLISSAFFLSVIEYTENGYTGKRNYNELMEQAFQAPLIILDDLGQDEKNRSRVANLLTHIYNNSALAIITSNVEPLKLPYDIRIASRIAEKSVVCVMDEPMRKGIRK